MHEALQKLTHALTQIVQPAVPVASVTETPPAPSAPTEATPEAPPPAATAEPVPDSTTTAPTPAPAAKKAARQSSVWKFFWLGSSDPTPTPEMKATATVSTPVVEPTSVKQPENADEAHAETPVVA